MSRCEEVDLPAPPSLKSQPMELQVLVDLVARRLELGIEVAAVKHVEGRQAEDPAREREILRWATGELDRHKLRRRFGIEFLRDQIEAGKLIQRALPEQWREQGWQLPPSRRNLTEQVRPELGDVNRRILLALTHLDRRPASDGDLLEDQLAERLSANSSLRHIAEARRGAAHIALRSLHTAPCVSDPV